MIDGDMEAGAWSCGMVAGLIHDIPTCRELIDRIMAEAEAIISQRLAGASSAPGRKPVAVPGIGRLPDGTSENPRQNHAAIAASFSVEAANAAWRQVTN